MTTERFRTSAGSGLISLIWVLTWVVIIFWSDIHLGASAAAGMGAVLISTVMQATSLMIVKRRARHLSPLAVTFGGMLGGVLVLWCLAPFLEDIRAQRFDMAGTGS